MRCNLTLGILIERKELCAVIIANEADLVKKLHLQWVIAFNCCFASHNEFPVSRVVAIVGVHREVFNCFIIEAYNHAS